MTTPPLTPEQIRQLLTECVTVIAPGETLVVRVPWDTSWMQVREYQRVIDSPEGGQIPFRVLVVAGDGLGTVQPGPDFMTRTRVEPLDGHEPLTVRLTHEPTGITIDARDRAEGICKLRKALTARARRDHDLQEAERRRQDKGTPGTRPAASTKPYTSEVIPAPEAPR